MGNQPSAHNTIKQAHNNDTIMKQFLKQFQPHASHKQTSVKSLSHGATLTVFQRKQQPFMSDQQNLNQLISLNYQSVCKLKTINEAESMRAHVNYYIKRMRLAADPDTDTVSSIVKLHHFTIRNEGTNELVYPQNKQWQPMKNKPESQLKAKKILPSCGLENIFTRRQDKEPSITTVKQQIFTFSFLQEFNMDSLEKEINFRKHTQQSFRQKEIWSIVYCCSKAAHKLITNGLKEPILSPASIFINEKCEIKVSEWEFVNYYFVSSGQGHSEEGEAYVIDERDLSQDNAPESKDILAKYYWPPEGLVEMQNILTLGEAEDQSLPTSLLSQRQKQRLLERQKLYEAKNSQVFCLAMTLLQLLTLKPYYQKSTYSEKQLNKLVQQAIDIREKTNQPMSQEIVDLLMEMLQWDPLERFRYSDIIEYIHQVFENNQIIFGEQTARAEIEVRTVRSEVDGSEPTDSQTHRAPKMEIKRVNQVSVSSNKKPSARISSKRKSFNQSYISHNENISKRLHKQDRSEKLILIDEEVDVRIDRMEDSGLMWPGKGDDYTPNEEEGDQGGELPVRSLYRVEGDQSHSFNLKRNQLRPSVYDCQDFPQNIASFTNSEELEVPDEDVDYEGSQLTQKHQQNLFSQQKRYVESFNINPLNQTFPNQEFSVYQYVPKHWPSAYKANSSRRTLNQQQHNLSHSKNQLNLSKQSFASFNLKFLNKTTENVNLKKNVSFDPFYNQSNPKFPSSPQNLHVNNLSTIVKLTHSPKLQRQINKENVQAFENYENKHNAKESNLFTSQKIMEMIKEFTKKQSQQTPDFNAIQLTNQKANLKNDLPKDTEVPKKLTFDENPSLFEKKFDKCYGSTLFESTSDRLFPLYQKQKPVFQESKLTKTLTTKSSASPMVRIEFAKGTYEGSIKNSLRNGYGTFYYKEGGKYSGYWYNNKMDGHGTLYYPDGRVAYEGQWQNDSLHGKGILHNENPVKIQGQYDFRSFDLCDNDQCWIFYDGWFENDEKCGFGQLLLSNHEKYVGEFRNDMIDGKGKFYKLDGTLFEGFWRQNRLVSEDE